MPIRSLLLFLWTLCLLSVSASALVLSSADEQPQGRAPADDPGFSNVGRLAGASAIYLGDGWVLSTAHQGVGDVVFDGVAYPALPGSRVPIETVPGVAADLQLFRLAQSPALPSLALRSMSPALDAPLVLVGAGRGRGTAVEWLGIEGFQWSSEAGLRWGTTRVTATSLGLPRDGFVTRAFVARFDATGDPLEAVATTGDSGGAAFVATPDGWQLQGVMFALSQFPGQPPGTALAGNSTLMADLGFYREQILAVTGELAPDPPPARSEATAGELAPVGPPLYAEDFELSAAEEPPLLWRATGAQNSLQEAGDLFRVLVLGDGNRALGTRSDATNIHSHLLTPESSDWTAYEMSGRMASSEPGGSVGVTLYSEYPRSNAYYRLRQHRGGSFHLAPHPHGAARCLGTTDTGVLAEPGVWYRYRFQARPHAEGTQLRARVWPDGSSEPQGWQLDCVDREGALQAGTPGVWSMGSGLKLWDDFEIHALGTVAEEVSAPARYLDDFEGYAAGDDPADWLDTAAGNSMVEDPELFQVIELADGNRVFGTVSSGTNVHSHLLSSGSSRWAAYELRGRMAASHRQAGLGVTLYSDYPRSDAYYRLRRYGGRGFHLSSHPYERVTCQGPTDATATARPATWYRFRFQAQPAAEGTRVRAKVWADGTPEPGSWSIDCVDEASTLEGGAPGLWSMGPGLKVWDDLEVINAGP